MKYIFRDINGVFSWRKALACLTGLIFAVSCMGWLFFNTRQLPKAYIFIIAGVFTFYFTKATQDKIMSRITKNKKDEPK